VAEKEKTPVPIYLVVALAVATLGVTVFIGIRVSKMNGGGSASEKKVEVEEMGPTREMGEFTVNLADGGYLKASMALELNVQTEKRGKELKEEEKMAKVKEIGDEVKKREPQIREAIMMILSSQRKNNLLSVEGKKDLKKLLLDGVTLVGEGRELKLREKNGELIIVMEEEDRKILKEREVKIKNIYITALTMQ